MVTTHDRITGWGRIQQIQFGKARKEGTLSPVYAGTHGPIIRYRDISPEGESAVLIPLDAIIFFDDPSYDDFSLLYDFDNKWADKKIDKQPIEVREIDNRKYFVRPKKYLFGYGFRNKVIFSTTELITLELIYAGYHKANVVVPPLMPNDKMYAGCITVMKTERVRKRWDGLLPPIVERLRRDGFEFEYFADGQGNDYNLVTSKGQNIFDHEDTLIEISQPHESKVIKLQHELQWDESDRFAVRVAICLDQMHQAIGRNSGYRWSDKEEYNDRREAVVLVEPLICDELCDKSRYYIRKQMDLGTEAVRRPTKKNFVSYIAWYVGNVRAYLVTGKNLEHDVKAALKSVSIIKKLQRHKRMYDSIKNAMKVFGNLPNLVRTSEWLEENHR